MNDTSIDRVPPQNIEAEQSVIGSMMLSKDAIIEAEATLVTSDFYRTAHQVVFDALRALNARDEAIDLITVQEELRSAGKLEFPVGGTQYLMALLDSVPTAANIGYYAKIVKEKSVARSGIEACTEAITRLYDGATDPETVLSACASRVSAICDGKGGKGSYKMSELVDLVYADAERYYRDGGTHMGYTTGLCSLDNMTNGYYPQQLVYIGGQPSSGKTAYTMNVLYANGKEGIPGVLFTAETGGRNLCQRMLATLSGLPMRKIRTGRLNDSEWTKLTNAAAEAYELPIYIEECAGWTIEKITAVARRHVARHSVKLVGLDFVQLIRTERYYKDDNERIADITYQLKALAQNEDACVLALSQFNRDYKGRSQQRPIMSDFRGSGMIEASADTMLALWRPQGSETTDEDNPIIPTDICILKQKDDMLGDCHAVYVAKRFKFTDVDTRHFPPATHEAKEEW